MKARPVQREVVAAMVGTAGHVDHGKTTLVGMLTGCDTDRLAEEKERGLSINLGFAPCVMPGRRLIGIVDVPGHKDFIRNMVAGAASIDVLLLVTAADDGVMPQTAEHMQIIRLLRKPQVMVALTKVDLVDDETRELARDDVAGYLARIGYPDVPIIETSSVTGDGLVAVRETLAELVDRVSDRTPDRRRFRMNVERTFSVEGYGTVATGIPISGRVEVGQKLTLLPSGKETAVRAVQIYKNDSDVAFGGACAAINVRDLAPEDVERGMTLIWPGAYDAVDDFVTTLESVAQDRALRRRFECKLHVGTSICDATVKLLDVESLPPGESGFARIQLAEPVTLTAGDRFVIRSLSPVTTVAGGSVLSVFPGRMKRSSLHLLPRLEAARLAIEEDDPLAAELLAGGDVLFRQDELKRRSRMDEATTTEHLERLVERGVLERLGAGGWLVAARLGELADRMAGELLRYHEAHPSSWGMTSTHVAEVLGLPVKSFRGIAGALSRDERIVVRYDHLAHRDGEPELSAKQIEQRDELLRRVEEGGLKPPAVGDLSQRLGISPSDMKTLTRMLAATGRIRVIGVNVISAEAYEECRRRLVSLFESRKEVALGDFREATGLSRNLAWTLLDVFDGEGLTRKIGDVRVLAASGGEAREGDRT